MKSIRCIVLISSIILVLSGCSLNLRSTTIVDKKSIPQEAFLSLTEDDQIKIERSTPVMLMNMYFMGINDQKPMLSVATLHPEYLNSSESLENALKLFEGYKVENIKIEDNLDKNRQINTTNTYHIIVSFEVTCLKGETKWIMGEGKHTYFVKFIKTKEDIWSIREMATSP